MPTTSTNGNTRALRKAIHPRDVVLVILLGTQLFRLQDGRTSLMAAVRNRFSLRNTTPSQESVFVFPDVEFRTRYYMGSWFDRNLSTDSIDCEVFGSNIDQYFVSEMHDTDVLYTHNELEHQVNTNPHWNVDNYLTYFLKILRKSTLPSVAIVAMLVGDTASNKTHVPVVAKTRPAGFLEANNNSENNSDTYFGIIWPLNMPRHYGPVHSYIRLVKAGKVTKWEDKKEAIIWRGSYTGVARTPLHTYGSRVQAVVANCHRNVSKIDVAFHDIPQKQSKIPDTTLIEELQQHCIRLSHTSMEQQLEYKYILSVEGNDVASGLKWQLASNSVVFMPKPTTVSFAMEDQLVPFYHYIPVDDNYTNLEEMLEWAIAHDDKAKKIAEQSTQYMKDLWMSEKAQQDYEQLQTTLAIKYQQQFASALWTCLPKETSNISKRTMTTTSAEISK